MAHLTIHIATPNSLTKRGTALFSGANAGLGPCSCAIRALRWVLQRLGIIGHMWRELLAQWPTLQYPPLPATPSRCVPPRLHTTQAHIPGWLAGTWFPPHCRCTIVTPTARHLAQHVPGVTHTMGHLTIHIHTPNTPAHARKQVCGAAPWGRARGSRSIREPRRCPRRLVIQDHMCSELPRGWPTLQSTLQPPTR